MSNPNGQHPYQGYGQPQQGYGGFGGPQTPYVGGPMPGAGAPAGPPPSRRGTSKALPIIVSVGLGIGVFGGLMIVRGTGTSDAASAGNSGRDGGIAAVDASVMAAAPIDAAPVATVTIDAAPPEPKERDVTISFDALPLDTVEISVDGKKIDGQQYRIKLLEGTSKKVTIVAKAPGYKTQKLDYTIEQDDQVTIHLDKRSGSSGGSSGRSGGRGGSGGLIDL